MSLFDNKSKKINKEDLTFDFGETARDNVHTSYSASLVLHEKYPSISSEIFFNYCKIFRRNNFRNIAKIVDDIILSAEKEKEFFDTELKLE